ncbi:DUF63 family protein [Candidatus Micrarchaeota archaeon]|nr:DUF63 family protein [Candidatus Micrarchaeota archaeon]
MEIQEFIQEYFIDYIWLHKGYNIYNTLFFALIALFCIWFIYQVFNKYKFKVDKKLIIATIPFVLFGSTMRVITDSIDTGVMQQYVLINDNIFTTAYHIILDSQVLHYGYLTVTPGIYIVIAFIFLSSLSICHIFKKMDYLKYIGILLFIPMFILLIPLIRYPIYPIIILILAISSVFVCYIIFKKFELDKFMLILVAAHGLDGATTFVSIDLFNKWEFVCTQFGRCYNEQHVVPSLLGTHTFFLFFLVKVSIVLIASYILSKEELKSNEKYYIILILLIMGLAPGVRNLLRIMIGA